MSEYIEHDREGVSVGIVEKKLFTFAEPPNEMVLENGAQLGPVTIAYETYGTLNSDKSNVVLILHALYETRVINTFLIIRIMLYSDYDHTV